MWEPGENQTQSGAPIDFMPAFNDAKSSGLQMSGYVYAQNWFVPGMQNPVPNATLVAIDAGNITLPNGQSSPVELGTLSLGQNDQGQFFSFGTTSAANPGISTWSIPGYLYNHSITSSYSYGLHIGSAALKYPGSLLFGGWDKGRAIGPPTTFGDTPLQLLDIVMGVETGGSPFNFSSQNDLLLDNTSTHNQLPVNPDPLVPYFHLPQQTCDKIASYLPVFYSATTQFYLWNTSDPTYANITSSAAYLGFVFPPAPGDTADVTIKVPFRLLNLTLTNPAIGSGKVTYFPCKSYAPSDNYLLGRAFLQAAFVGRNWNRHVSWLAQAPGPGPANQGMGSQLTDIADSDTTLPMYAGDQYFNQSWAGHWTPLPGTTAPQPIANTTSPSNPNNNSNNSTGLSVGAKAGIGIGAAAVAVLAIGIGAFLLMRRKRKSDRASEQEPFVAHAHEQKSNNGAAPPQYGQPQSPYSDQPGGYMGSPPQGYAQPHQPYDQSYHNTAYVPYGKEQPGIPMQELHGGSPIDPHGARELPGSNSPTELEARGQEMKPAAASPTH